MGFPGYFDRSGRDLDSMVFRNTRTSGSIAKTRLDCPFRQASVGRAPRRSRVKVPRQGKLAPSSAGFTRSPNSAANGLAAVASAIANRTFSREITVFASRRDAQSNYGFGKAVTRCLDSKIRRPVALSHQGAPRSQTGEILDRPQHPVSSIPSRRVSAPP